MKFSTTTITFFLANVILILDQSHVSAGGNLRATAGQDAQALRRLQACDSRCSQTGATGKQVDVNGADFQQAIDDYISGGINQGVGSSPYGNIIDCWDTSKVTDMSNAFASQETFNEKLECWDTSSVTTMGGMFLDAKKFNQYIGSWDVSNVETMYTMFYGALVFNEAIDLWNVEKVTEFGEMFSGALTFNQPLADWNITSATDATLMFAGASAFNQDLCSWEYAGSSLNVDVTTGMFSETACSDQNDPDPDNAQTSWCAICFSNYAGVWKQAGSNSQDSYEACASWSQAQSNTYSSSFSASMTNSIEEVAKFGDGADEAEVKVTESVTEGFQVGVSQTLEETNGGSSCQTCTSVECDGLLFQWFVNADGSDGTSQYVKSCNFQCVPESIPNGHPMCPEGYCEDISCQCCNAIWLDGNDDPDANYLSVNQGGNCVSPSS